MPRRAKPLTREKLIRIIEARLKNPETSPEQFDRLTRRLMKLRGWTKPGNNPPDPEIEPVANPEPVDWWKQVFEKMSSEQQAQYRARTDAFLQRGRELDAVRRAQPPVKDDTEQILESLRPPDERAEREKLIATLKNVGPSVDANGAIAPKVKPVSADFLAQQLQDFYTFQNL